MDGKCLGIGCSFAHAEKVRFFFPPDNVLLYLLVGASFCYMGGCTLNDAMDKDFDDQHNPNRPIPSAKISLSQAWLLGLIQLGLGGVLLIIGAECSPLWIALLLLSILSYDWIHKKWAGGVFIMGGCRLFLWLGAATVGMETDIAPQTWGWGLRFMDMSWEFHYMRKTNPLIKKNLSSSHFPPLFAIPLCLGWIGFVE